MDRDKKIFLYPQLLTCLRKTIFRLCMTLSSKFLLVKFLKTKFEKFVLDKYEMRIDATIRNLEIIGEAETENEGWILRSNRRMTKYSVWQ